VSHQPERKEKNCLNCGTIVAGRYCQTCGQENILPKQSFTGIIKHFIYDIFHFDGKFFDTLKQLLFRPGRVPAEYMAGKRVHYLDPMRMYLFTASIFFLVFFSLRDLSNTLHDKGIPRMTRIERNAKAFETATLLRTNPSDSVLYYKLNLLLDTIREISLEPASKGEPINDSFDIALRNGHYKMVPERDSVVFALPVEQSWIEKKIQSRYKAKKEAMGGDDNKAIATLISEFQHKLPYLLFVSLPLFALILKLLYFRRKDFYYSDHAIFTLYHYIFNFILLLFYFGLDELQKWSHWGIFKWLITIVMILWPLYLLIGMKNFYRQRWGKTIVKFLLLDILGFITLLILFLIFIFISFIF
jgi:hypothetical protein